MKYKSTDILRIIDANINRTGEGLRVLEEFARMTLDNAPLTQQLKELRHKLLHNTTHIQSELMNARDADIDVGSTMEVAGESKEKAPAEIVIANSRRVQESLRVLEELAKAPEVKLDSEVYRQSRFAIYTIEKELLGKLLRQDIINKIKGLYVIIDTAWLRGRTSEELTLKAIAGGAKTIQLRQKTGTKQDFLTTARSLKGICAAEGVPLIINDSLEIALACKADGVHLGQEDLPADSARSLMPIDMVLGVSVRSANEAQKALEDGADYVGAGAIFKTDTKDSSALGLAELKAIQQSVKLPVVAIGGINKDNIKSVFDAGACAAAVISAALGADDVKKAVRELVKNIGGLKNE